MSFPGPQSTSSWKPLLKQRFEGALDLVFPRACRSCELPLGEKSPHSGMTAWLCGKCLDEIDKIERPYCEVCGEPFSGPMTTAFRCSNCEGRRLAFDFAISGYKAQGPLRELIHLFKYGKDLSLRGVLAAALIKSLADARLEETDLSEWLLVPVPLHFFREMRREFNQSWELCQELSASTGISAVKVLRRTRQTSAQAKLHRNQRLENLRGVFALRHSLPWSRRPDLQGRKILLVDDVLTTGATAHECAKILKRDAGAEKVVVITAARG